MSLRYIDAGVKGLEFNTASICILTLFLLPDDLMYTLLNFFVDGTS